MVKRNKVQLLLAATVFLSGAALADEHGHTQRAHHQDTAAQQTYLQHCRPAFGQERCDHQIM